ncbi:MAG: hypothetical protein LLG01_10885 [Planctomycetaceae bacterium]|nr:hypothetical protein [Planctomycetaceae bacterium]
MNQTATKPWIKNLNFWPLLAGPLAFGLIMLLGQFAWSFGFWVPGEVNHHYAIVKTVWTFNDPANGLNVRLDELGPFLLLVALAAYWIKSILTRNPLYLVLTLMTGSLLCREIHFTGMDKAIYVLGVLVVITLIAWRKTLVAPLADWRHNSWLIAAVVTYVLSQAVARGAFKFIPGVRAMHLQLEEGIETAAHLVLIVTSLVGSWRRYSVTAVPAGELEELPQVPATAQA